MYSRRFYGGERTQRSRGVPTAMMSSEKTPPNAKSDETSGKAYFREASVTDTSPRRALDIVCINEENPYQTQEYINPKDFSPTSDKKSVPDMIYGKEQSSFCLSCAEISSSVPEESCSEKTDDITEKEPKESDFGLYENLFGSSVSQMTLEDMMLAGLLMLGSSGEYDDEIMLILGLILVIGT